MVGLLGKRKKPGDTAKATPAKKARNGDTASTPQQNGESKQKFKQSSGVCFQGGGGQRSRVLWNL